MGRPRLCDCDREVSGSRSRSTSRYGGRPRAAGGRPHVAARQRPGVHSRVDNGDYSLNVWAVDWVARTLPTDPTHLFDANIFYPARLTLAYSEPLILQARLPSRRVAGRAAGGDLQPDADCRPGLVGVGVCLAGSSRHGQLDRRHGGRVGRRLQRASPGAHRARAGAAPGAAADRVRGDRPAAGHRAQAIRGACWARQSRCRRPRRSTCSSSRGGPWPARGSRGPGMAATGSRRPRCGRRWPASTCALLLLPVLWPYAELARTQGMVRGIAETEAARPRGPTTCTPARACTSTPGATVSGTARTPTFPGSS